MILGYRTQIFGGHILQYKILSGAYRNYHYYSYTIHTYIPYAYAIRFLWIRYDHYIEKLQCTVPLPHVMITF